MKNQVLQNGFKVSSNFWESDRILEHYLDQSLSKDGKEYMQDKLDELGKKAAGTMNALSLDADKFGPRLVKRNFYGENIDEIQFHPAYNELKKIAIESELFHLKWEPTLRKRFVKERHHLGFSAGFLFAMSECSLFCPLCMTDAAARLLDKHASEEVKQRILPHIASKDLKSFYTGAMFLTEKAGGSDVGANLVTAQHHEGDYYLLNGEKWFCSNADAEVVLVLARTNPEVKGTKGLSIFLIEKERLDGTSNKLGYIRLKDKLGVRSMASAECLLQGTLGLRIGKEGEGFKIMTEMINLSRLYNSVAAIATMRRGLIEAYQFLSYRKNFGKIALEHALIRHKFEELAALYQANFYLTWRCIEALDKADNGDMNEAELLRILTPMAKKATAEASVYVLRESMELMGGMGYIEDGVLPKTFRDALVLPIWEGAGNIMLLDMLRAAFKSKGLSLLIQEIQSNLYLCSEEQQILLSKELRTVSQLVQSLNTADQDVLELSAKIAFERLTKLYHISLLLRYEDKRSKKWTRPAVNCLIKQLKGVSVELQTPVSRKTIEDMIAWSF